MEELKMLSNINNLNKCIVYGFTLFEDGNELYQKFNDEFLGSNIGERYLADVGVVYGVKCYFDGQEGQAFIEYELKYEMDRLASKYIDKLIEQNYDNGDSVNYKFYIVSSYKK